MATIHQLPAPKPAPLTQTAADSLWGACLLRLGFTADAMTAIGEHELAAAMTPADLEAEMSARQHVVRRHDAIERRMTSAGPAAVLQASR
jgi:hypothetical protein